MKTDPTQNINQYLAKHKGISIQEAEGMNDYVTQMAAQVGVRERRLMRGTERHIYKPN